MLFEDDGFVAVQQHAVFTVPLDGAGQNLAFGVTALRGEVFYCFGVIHARHVLFNDGAFVQIGGDIVRCGANQFNAALVCLVIGLGALEAGQK